MSDSYIQSNSSAGKVECHAPRVVQRHIKFSQNSGVTKTAADSVVPPIKINLANKNKSGTASTGKYVKSRYMAPSSRSNRTLSSPNTSKEAKTSTPACKLAGGMPHLDVSDINASYMPSKSHGRSQRNMSLTKDGTGTLKSNTSVRPKLKKPLLNTNTKNESHRPINRKKSAKDDSVTDDTALLYNEYLQWKFLNAKLENLQKHRNSKSLAAVETLLKVDEENIEEHKDLEMDIMRLKHLQKLRIQLEEENENISNITGKLPSLKENFTQLSNNLEMTCHRLPLKEIYPIDEEKMSSTLIETRQLLGESNILIQSKTELVRNMKTATEDLSNKVQDCKDISEKVNATMTETLHDTLKLQSLLIQDIVTS